jgi:predicted CopG family antitoxin
MMRQEQSKAAYRKHRRFITVSPKNYAELQKLGGGTSFNDIISELLHTKSLYTKINKNG